MAHNPDAPPAETHSDPTRAMIESKEKRSFSPMDPALVARLHSLPPGLLLDIKDFTLQPNRTDQNEMISITEGWQTPSFLHITSASREKCAKAYYATNTFDFSSVHIEEGFKLCAKWFDALPATHRNYAQRATLTGHRDQPTQPLDFSATWQAMCTHDSTQDAHSPAPARPVLSLDA